MYRLQVRLSEIETFEVAGFEINIKNENEVKNAKAINFLTYFLYFPIIIVIFPHFSVTDFQLTVGPIEVS